jgi:hypothetical protein
MDPLTAGLQLANTIAHIILVTIQSQPKEVRAEYAKAQLEDFMAFRNWVQSLAPKEQP